MSEIKKKKIGYFSADVINALNESIIAYPDYVGKNGKDNSIEFTKEYCIAGDYVKVVVRVY